MNTISQNCGDLFSYIFTRGETQEKREKKSLKYMREFAALTQLNPHKVKIIHIAGSKGKGSVGIHIANGLQACGCKVGLYTSPHVSHWYERINILGEAMNEKRLLKIGNYLQRKVIEHKKETRYNFFEWLTLLAMHYFIESHCDYVVLETGLGGRFDSTNIFTPVATVTTLIEREHTELLGDTLAEIAFQKGGIIKKGSANFSYFQESAVKEVLKACSRSASTKTYFLDEFIETLHSDVSNHRAKLRGEEDILEFETALLGEHQAYNALLALAVLRYILAKRYPRYKSRIVKSFSTAFLPGRLQVVSKNPLIIVDSAHTAHSVAASVETVLKMVGAHSIEVLFGCAQGKDMKGMLLSISKLTSKIHLTKPGSFKKSDINAIEEISHSIGLETHRIDDTYQACRTFLEKESDVYYSVGSFFLSDIFLQVFHEKSKILCHE